MMTAGVIWHNIVELSCSFLTLKSDIHNYTSNTSKEAVIHYFEECKIHLVNPSAL